MIESVMARTPRAKRKAFYGVIGAADQVIAIC